jgi:hypothetical protein
VQVGPGALLQAPLEDESPIKEEIRKLYCEGSACPKEVLTPFEDCTLNVSSPFTLQICRVEDVDIDGSVLGGAVHVQSVRTISISATGVLSASALGCQGGLGKGGYGGVGAGGGGGHGGRGGKGYFKGSFSEGGAQYGSSELPCEFGSGSGDSSFGNFTTGGGIIGLPLFPLVFYSCLFPYYYPSSVSGNSLLFFPAFESTFTERRFFFFIVCGQC